MHPAYVQGYVEVMTKIARISEEDIAAGLAGIPRGDITPEEAANFAHASGREAFRGAKSHPWWGLGIGGTIGGLIGAPMGASVAEIMGRGIGSGGLVGGGLGALAGGGLGYLLGRANQKTVGSQGKYWGQELGDIARTGYIPRDLTYEDRHGREVDDLVPWARGIQEETAQPLSRDEFDAVRKRLQDQYTKEMGIQGAIGGAGLGGLAGGGDDSNWMGELAGRAAGAAIGGGAGALEGMQYARSRANLLSDLYERGYGNLAGRLYERD